MKMLANGLHMNADRKERGGRTSVHAGSLRAGHARPLQDGWLPGIVGAGHAPTVQDARRLGSWRINPV